MSCQRKGRMYRCTVELVACKMANDIDNAPNLLVLLLSPDC